MYAICFYVFVMSSFVVTGVRLNRPISYNRENSQISTLFSRHTPVFVCIFVEFDHPMSAFSNACVAFSLLVAKTHARFAVERALRAELARLIGLDSF